MKNVIRLSQVAKASCNCGIPVPLEGAEVIRMMIELRSNDEILDYMNRIYGSFRPFWLANSQKRKFMALMQNFILQNYGSEFKSFLKNNKIEIFNNDFEASRRDSTYARFIYVVFFREYLHIKPPIIIYDDLNK
jgi:hypothetical protein